MRILSTQFH